MIVSMKNKYIIRSRISEAKTREFLKYFCLYIEAIKIAKLSKNSYQSINKIIKNLRILIAKECEKTSKMQGETLIDESYFGGVLGKRGRGAGKKTPFASCSRPSARRNVKARGLRLYTNSQSLLC